MKLGELLQIRTGKLDANAASENGIYPFFTCSKDPLKIDTYSYDCECVLLAGNGDLNVKYYNGKFDAYQRTYILENNNIYDLNMQFLYYFMLRYVDELRKQSIGGVIKYIKLNNITEAIIKLPDIKNQSRIVDELYKIEKAIGYNYKIIDDIENLIKSRFIEMFGDVADKNDKIELKDLCVSIIDGSHNPSKGIDKISDYYMLSSKNVIDNILNYDDPRYLSDEEWEIENKRTCVEKGDVLLTIVGTVGRTAVFNDDKNVTFQRSVAILKPKKEKLNSIYLKYCLDAMNRDILEKAHGVAQIGIYLAQVRELYIWAPTIKEQNEFAAFVEECDKLKFVVKNRIKLLEELMENKMHEYFDED